MSPRDDDALSWAGDDDPTLVSAPAADETAVPRRAKADPSALTTTPSAAPAPSPADSEPAPTSSGADADGGMSSAALVSLGVLGGIYLLYTIGWIIGGLRLNGIAGFIVAPTAFVPAVIVAVAAPAIWFGVAFLLTRERPSWQRFAWLAAGAVLLVPWPFVMLGTGL